MICFLVGDLQKLVQQHEPGLNIYRESAKLHAQLQQVKKLYTLDTAKLNAATSR